MLKKLTATIVLCLLTVSFVHAAPFTGSLSTGAGITATPNTGTWATQGVSLSWIVSDNGNGTWNYSYTFVTPAQGALSHIIIEVSPGVTLNDFSNILVNGSAFSGQPEVKEHTPQQGNPDMPGNLYGIKFDVETNLTSTTISFDINRAPVWGDFYAKDGSPGGQAWNTGFLLPDPTAPPSNGSIDFHILRPDTEPLNVIPAPAGVLLALTGLPLLGVGAWIRRRKA